MAMKGLIRIGSVRGVAVQAHWSVPLIMLLFAYGLAARTLPAYAPGWAPAMYAVAGVVGALLLLASLVVHEAAHALTARRAGIPVRDVTLWALGGMTRMDQPTTARAAFAVAVSGPLASLMLGGATIAGAVGVHAVLGWRMPVAMLGWLGGMNVLLGVFNLLPAAPLDGGRVLQAVLWWRTRDRERAQRAAGRCGQVIGMVLAVLGWLAFVRGVSGGLWLMVIGVTVDRFLADVAAQTRHSVLALVDFEGRPSGIVQLRRLAAVPSGRQQALRVQDLATPLSRCTLAAPDELLTAVLERLGSGGGLPILVMDGGRLGGIVTAHDIQRLYQRNPAGRESGAAPPDGGGGSRPRIDP
jgi:Zn-dependent protease